MYAGRILHTMPVDGLGKTVSETFPANPPRADTVMVETPVWPTGKVTDVGLALIMKSERTVAGVTAKENELLLAAWLESPA
jgi:hypothetical protein